KRRYVTGSNLHHAFPDKSEEWIKRMSRLNSRRMMELFMFALAAPYLSRRRVRKMFVVDDSTRQYIRDFHKKHKSGVALVPHITMMETLVMIPEVCPEVREYGDIVNIFRPFDNPHL